MDAKSKAEFINSVASGQEIVCGNCGTRASGRGSFCSACGAQLNKVTPEASAPENNAPAFAPVSEEPASEAAFSPVLVSEEPVSEAAFSPVLVSEEPVSEVPFSPVLVSEEPASEVPFNPVTVSEAPASEEPVGAARSGKKVPESRYVEPNNVFAQGLPDWDIVPPQVMVRRR